MRDVSCGLDSRATRLVEIAGLRFSGGVTTSMSD
jgi:hypothetical protein